jgi:hypothetical protein
MRNLTRVSAVDSTGGQSVYEVRPRKDYRGVDLISDVLPFGWLWYGEPSAVSNAIGFAKFYARSHDAVIRVYDEAGNVIESHRAQGRVQRTVNFFTRIRSHFPLKGIFPSLRFYREGSNTHYVDFRTKSQHTRRRDFPKGSPKGVGFASGRQTHLQKAVGFF